MNFTYISDPFICTRQPKYNKNNIKYFYLLTKHSHVWHWYIHCWPLRNLTFVNSWWTHDACALQWAQQIDCTWSLFVQSHSIREQRKRPLVHVQLVQSFENQAPSFTSVTALLPSLYKQPTRRGRKKNYNTCVLIRQHCCIWHNIISTYSIYTSKRCYRHWHGS